MYIEAAHKKVITLLSEHGIDLDGFFLKYIMFADDCAIITDDLEDLSELLEKFDSVYQEFGLKISAAKSELMAFSRDNYTPPVDFTVMGETMIWVRKFTYLGVTITSDGRTSQDTINKCRRARGVINSMSPIWTSKNLRQDSKQRIYKTIFEPTILYGSETWV